MIKNAREKYDLNFRVDRFIEDYAKRIKGRGYTDIGEYGIPIGLRDHIEAKAVYVELRHPIIRDVDEGFARDKNMEAKERFKWEFFDLAEEIDFPFAEQGEIDTMTLYRVIERGRCGANIDRALDFALEKGLDVKIPLIYGAHQHLSTDKLLAFMPPLTFSTTCPTYYFNRTSDDLKKVKEITILDILNERKSHDKLARERVAILG